MREIKNFASRHTYRYHFAIFFLFCKKSAVCLFFSPHAPHLHFIADTIGALGWGVAGDRPSHFVRESYDAGKHHVKNIPGQSQIFKKLIVYEQMHKFLLVCIM